MFETGLPTHEYCEDNWLQDINPFIERLLSDKCGSKKVGQMRLTVSLIYYFCGNL